MKLAQALLERADLQRRLQQLSQRMQQNAVYQEDESPSENPEELLAEYRRTAEQWQHLVTQINLANSKITLQNGETMTAALATRDRLKQEHTALIALANAALPEQNRYSRSEIKLIAAVNIKNIRSQADKIAQAARQLDLQIQEANWTNDL